MMIYRKLLFVVLCVLGSLAAIQPAEARDWKDNLLDQDRCLTLYRVSSKENSTFCYWRKGFGYDRAGYAKANWILRDVTYRTQVAMDPLLLDTLFIIQQWLILEGRSGEIKILSGYRTPENNRKTKGSARLSQHMQGTAADIHVPGVSTKLLAAMSRIIGVGGVGIYIEKKFVHVDTAGVRIWAG
ncbi:YcbK family protein [Pseudomonas sp. PLMAX]|jgi:uncharacterized protein YcbK (DUF882 family)|uniref:YcbK family protein n=1 Tax=Pseudomonas sp. PLMAX TaxID=2201998 RepID=UPI0038BB5250